MNYKKLLIDNSSYFRIMCIILIWGGVVISLAENNRLLAWLLLIFGLLDFISDYFKCKESSK